MSESTEPVQTLDLAPADEAPTPTPRKKRKYSRRKKVGVAGTEQQCWNDVEERVGRIFKIRVRDAMDEIFKSVEAGDVAASLTFDAKAVRREVVQQAARVVARALGLQNGNGQAE